MAVPKQKVSKARRRKRFAHWRAGNKVVTMRCRHCGNRKRPHVACPYCGYHKNRQVLAKPPLADEG